MVFHSKIVKFAVDELSKISWGTFTVFGSLLLLYSLVRKVKINKVLPPGPLGKPWVGVLFNIKKQLSYFSINNNDSDREEKVHIQFETIV